jgi:ubiquinone/menaquinone biosynthesis C-methylase UbiE
MRAYYDLRASEYDEMWEAAGDRARPDRPQWLRGVAKLKGFLSSQRATTTLDIGCGTGFLSQHLPGFVVGLDQSRQMLERASPRLANGLVVVGDALALPFVDSAFDLAIACRIYGHLQLPEATRALAEARRVARRVAIVESVHRADTIAAGTEFRQLRDGSTYAIYKRYFSGAELAAEIGGSVAHENEWFVAAEVPGDNVLATAQ